MVGRNDLCWCGSLKKWKKCHFPLISQPQRSPINFLVESKKSELKRHHILLKNDEQIKKIRSACQLASKILDATCKMAKVGVTTQELNDYAHMLHLEAGAIPAPLHYGYPPFPKSICTSLNEVICHGIPNEIPLRDGDILNIDITCILDGYFGDCSRMVTIGKINTDQQRVVDVSYECLMRAIAILQPGIPLSKIGETIEDYASSQGCSVVNQFVGHGIGLHFHEGPQIPHYRNHNSIVLLPGMTFTIEPMINAGAREAVIDVIDQWTARTKDGRPSAQWEHTVLITEKSCEVLTTWQRNS